MKLNSRGYYDTGYIKYLTIEEFKAVKEYIESLESPSMKMCIKVMMFTGLPVSDATQLKRELFTQDFRRITKIRQKTKRPLDVPVPSFIAQELSEYWETYQERTINGYLFFANFRNQSTSEHIKRSSVEMVICRMRKKTAMQEIYYKCKDGKNLYRISAHTLRHFVAWRIYAAAGNDLKAAQQWLGHSKIETTAKYVNALDSANMRTTLAETAFSF